MPSANGGIPCLKNITKKSEFCKATTNFLGCPLNSFEAKKLNFYNITTGGISNFQICLPNDTNHDLTRYGSSNGGLFYMDKYSLLVLNPLSGTSFVFPNLISNHLLCPHPISLSFSEQTCINPTEAAKTAVEGMYCLETVVWELLRSLQLLIYMRQ